MNFFLLMLSLAEELDFLAAHILHSEADPNILSEWLEFDRSGREKHKSRSISEDKLWRRIRTAGKRRPGKGIPEESDNECLPFAPIPMGPPSDGEIISRDDIRMGSNLSAAQQDELYAFIMENITAFSKGSHLGKVSGSKATINIEGNLPAPQSPRPVGPEKRKIIEETINQLLA